MTNQILYLKLKTETQAFPLPQTLATEGFKCAVLELKGTISPWKKENDLFLCGNFLSESIIQGKSLPILRRIYFEDKNLHNFQNINVKFEKLLWVDVSRKKIDEVKLYLCDDEGRIPSFTEVALSCTLVCIPHL